MLELCVGKRPNAISGGAYGDFNAVFIAMFEYFQTHERIVTIWNDNHPEDPLGTFGSLTVAGVRRWLEYYQLVTVSKAIETVEKKRNLTIICPTKRGQAAYEAGQLITVDHFSEQTEIGIGKPYPKSSTDLQKMAYAIWHKKNIAMSRQEKWNFELRQKCDALLNRENDKAVQQITAWAEEKAWDWINNHKRKRKSSIKNSETPLGIRQRTLSLWQLGGV